MLNGTIAGDIRRGIREAVARAALMDPEQQAYALESMGIEPTAEVLAALNSSIEALNGLASSPTMGPDIAAVA